MQRNYDAYEGKKHIMEQLKHIIVYQFFHYQFILYGPWLIIFSLLRTKAKNYVVLSCGNECGVFYQLFLSKGILVSGGHHILKSIEKPDLSVFSDSEKEILEFVAEITHTDGGKKILKTSHDEEAFKKTEPLQLISYEFSKNLKI